MQEHLVSMVSNPRDFSNFQETRSKDKEKELVEGGKHKWLKKCLRGEISAMGNEREPIYWPGSLGFDPTIQRKSMYKC